jgi:cell division protein FtsQ
MRGIALRNGGKTCWLDRGHNLRIRLAARLSAIAALGLVVVSGLVQGGYLDYEDSPWLKLPGRAAGMVGLSAGDIRIRGLTHHEPDLLLSAIAVAPGSPLIGFDAGQARRQLESLDWVAAAKVQRIFPNQLEIAVVERAPFAVWQRGATYSVIDRDGSVMTGLPASQLVKLPLVSGEGANLAAQELINQLEAYPDLMLQVKAASRVGKRRWNLYLDSGVMVLLPEGDWTAALAELDRLDRSQRLLSKGIKSVDLRLGGQMTVAVAELPEDGETGDAKAENR